MLEKWLTCALGDSPWELHCPGRVTFRLTELINAVLLPRPLVPACPAGSEAETGPGVLGAKLPPEAPGSAPSCRPCPQRAQQPKAAGRRGQGTLRAFPPSGNHLPNLLTVNRCPAVKVSGSLKWGGGVRNASEGGTQRRTLLAGVPGSPGRPCSPGATHWGRSLLGFLNIRLENGQPQAHWIHGSEAVLKYPTIKIECFKLRFGQHQHKILQKWATVDLYPYYLVFNLVQNHYKYVIS